jgi:3-dehydroquinate synthase
MIRIPISSEIDYEVVIGEDWKRTLGEICEKHRKVFVIAPEFIAGLGELQSKRSESSFLFLSPEGEAQKDFATLERIWTLLGEVELGRADAIVGIGGGATTDVAGFVAATWLRGVSWYAIPTTLAGMVDAAIGGKTGINTMAGKNLIGSFHSPAKVCIDISWLLSLSDRDFAAGLAEVIKTGFISDPSILDLLDGCSGISEARKVAQALIAKSVSVKARVVSEDFTEGRLREILNFGHTFGHAVEKSAGYSLRHGEAVSIGLHFAAVLSEEILDLKNEEVERLLNLLTKFGLPTTIDKESFPWLELLALMTGDKKSRNGQIRFIGVRAAGEPEWVERPSLELLERTYEKIAR